MPRVLNFERAEVVLVPASVWEDIERDIIAPRAKVIAPAPPEDSDPIAYLEQIALIRWGPAIQEKDPNA